AQGAVPGPGRAAARQKLSLRREKARSLAQVVGGTIDLQDPGGPAEVENGPLAVFQMLKSMCAWQRLASEPQDSAAVSLLTSSVPETLKASFLSARNSSPTARPTFSSGPRPAASRVLPHSLAATHSPFSPALPHSLRLSCCLLFLRNKGSTSLRGAVALLECSGRKGSSQGTPCQPSATRLPTWGRPGKSPMRGST
uniref:Uncharacterized protein n=1 Tax=Rhinopithecus roxellana TaxID=61622 RepID=A0A2K6NPJ2_RHIRO